MNDDDAIEETIYGTTYVSVVAVDAAATVFVGKYLEDVPMIDAVDHANAGATMDYADGHDSVSYAVIGGDSPTATMMSAIDAWTRHDAASVMDCPT